MMKQSSSTVVGTNTSTSTFRLAPSKPNSSKSKASSIRDNANSACSLRRLAQLISTVVVMAPITKAPTYTMPAMIRVKSPSTKLSATDDTMPVMWEV